MTYLHQELQSLLLIDFSSTEELKQSFVNSLEQRNVAGVVFLEVQKKNKELNIQTHWDNDISGNLANKTSPSDILLDISKKIPQRLCQWMAFRKNTFWLRKYIRFIPFTAKLIFKHSSPHGNQRLSDLLFIPVSDSTTVYAVMIGFVEPVKPDTIQDLTTLSLAYISKAARALATHQEDKTSRYSVLNLSDKQIECLRWLAAGKTLEETAIITNMSYSNVRYHLNQAKKKYGYKSTQQLIVHASVFYEFSPT